MPRQRARRSQMKALLALYRVMETTALDLETVTFTYSVSNRVAEDAFKAAVDRGFLEQESGLFLLTAKGENEIDELFTRGRSQPIVVPKRPPQHS